MATAGRYTGIETWQSVCGLCQGQREGTPEHTIQQYMVNEHNYELCSDCKGMSKIHEADWHAKSEYRTTQDYYSNETLRRSVA